MPKCVCGSETTHVPSALSDLIVLLFYFSVVFPVFLLFFSSLFFSRRGERIFGQIAAEEEVESHPGLARTRTLSLCHFPFWVNCSYRADRIHSPFELPVILRFTAHTHTLTQTHAHLHKAKRRKKSFVNWAIRLGFFSISISNAAFFSLSDKNRLIESKPKK